MLINASKLFAMGAVTQAVAVIHTRSKLKEVGFSIVMRLVPKLFLASRSLVGGKTY